MPSIRVRMYRQGLGDCFLLTIDDGGDTHHVLIDFGVLLGTPDAGATMHEVAADIVSVSAGRLDVVVATHEHWDHISGFSQAADVLAGLDVGEAWLGWTELPHDTQAEALRERRRNALRAIDGAASALRGIDDGHAARLDGLAGFHGGLAADGRPTTANAFQQVKDMASTIRYLEPGSAFAAFGMRVFVLGPPRDITMLRKSDPSRATPEVYELTDGDVGFGAAREPFERLFRLEPDAVERYPLLARRYAADDWRRIDHDWLGTADDLALRLDSDTNNTSVVLAFELGDEGPVLLFPGDAQVGSWLSWDALEWPSSGGDTVRSEQLLARTVLYKVGHHGSHNATLRARGLELMTSPDLVAMIPVDRVTAAKQHWNMPLPSLLRRLEERTRGRILDAQLGRPETRPDALNRAEWETFLARSDVQPRWVDYVVDW